MNRETPVQSVTAQEGHFSTEARSPAVLKEGGEKEDLPLRLLEASLNGMINDSKSFQAGILAHFYEQKKEMGAPEIILKMIKSYRIPFSQKPPLSIPKST